MPGVEPGDSLSPNGARSGPDRLQPDPRGPCWNPVDVDEPLPPPPRQARLRPALGRRDRVRARRRHVVRRARVADHRARRDAGRGRLAGRGLHGTGHRGRDRGRGDPRSLRPPPGDRGRQRHPRARDRQRAPGGGDGRAHHGAPVRRRGDLRPPVHDEHRGDPQPDPGARRRVRPHHGQRDGVDLVRHRRPRRAGARGRRDRLARRAARARARRGDVRRLRRLPAGDAWRRPSRAGAQRARPRRRATA